VDTVLAVIERHMGKEIEAEFVIGPVHKLCRQFVAKEIDLIIVFSIDVPVSREKYFTRNLKKIPRGVICAPDHPLAGIDSLKLTDVRNETLCVFDDSYSTEMERNILEDCLTAGFTPKAFRRYHDWRSLELALHMKKGIMLAFQLYFGESRYPLAFRPFALEDERNDNRLVACWYEDSLDGVAEHIRQAFEENAAELTPIR